MMERRTFLGVAAAFLGLRRFAAPTRPMRSKPYIEEGRPEYEEPPAPFGRLVGGHVMSTNWQLWYCSHRVGTIAIQLDSGERLIAHDPYRLMCPASQFLTSNATNGQRNPSADKTGRRCQAWWCTKCNDYELVYMYPWDEDGKWDGGDGGLPVPHDIGEQLEAELAS